MGRYLQVIPEYTEVSEFWLKTVDRRFLFRESFIDLDSTPIITNNKKISGKRGNLAETQKVPASCGLDLFH